MDKYESFIFEGFNFDFNSGVLSMNYSYDGIRLYEEKATFSLPKDISSVDRSVINSLCLYTFMIAGSSYYKSFLPSKVVVRPEITQEQADFFTMIYRGGLSQYVFENKLDPSDLVTFRATTDTNPEVAKMDLNGILLMQSGGKDSLLSSVLLKKAGHSFDAWHMSTTGKYPAVVDETGAEEIVVSKRRIDLEKIIEDKASGGLNGHIPFSALYAGFGLIQAALLGRKYVIASNEASADQANITIDGYDINHQFSKTYEVELAIQRYLHTFVTPSIQYGSLLRPFSELKVGELFAKEAWPQFKYSFSSCNLANYKQNEDDGVLRWDGTCPKCANTFLLLAPFVDHAELLSVFNNKNLLQAEDMHETYLQLLGQSTIKPFECVGTFEEMNEAYRLTSQKNPTFVSEAIQPVGVYEDWRDILRHQSLFDDLLDYSKL